MDSEKVLERFELWIGENIAEVIELRCIKHSQYIAGEGEEVDAVYLQVGENEISTTIFPPDGSERHWYYLPVPLSMVYIDVESELRKQLQQAILQSPEEWNKQFVVHPATIIEHRIVADDGRVIEYREIR